MLGALDPMHDERQRAESEAPARVVSELRDAMREAALDVLKPVVRRATTNAAKYAVTKGPDIVDRVAPKLIGASGATAVAIRMVAKRGRARGGVVQLARGIATKAVKAKVTGGGNVVGGIADKVTGDGKEPTGHGRGRRLPVQEQVDVAADLETVYDQFTQFEDWPRFMHRVERVEHEDDATVMLHENIWGVRRSWEAEIVQQIPCERMVWRSMGPLQTLGVATFHRLSDNLTRVQLNMDFQPQGLFERTASGTRVSRRALRSDLMRFRAFVEMRDEATGAWRGVIEEDEVSESPEEHEELRGREASVR
jgi:uncharacterized membrane protein